MSDDAGIGLTGSWRHSYEEDAGGVDVYRPSDSFAFPPSRRPRETLVFGPAGQVQVGAPGADDRQRTRTLQLTALGMGHYRFEGGDVPGQIIDIVESGPDVLKLRRS